MPKYDRAESYDIVLSDAEPVKSPREAKPCKFALVCFDGDQEGAAGWVTTHKTITEVCEHCEQMEGEFIPSFVVDLDTGASYDLEITYQLVETDDDYFAAEDEEEGAEGEEGAAEEEEEEEEEEESEEAPPA
jgi:hypothetical protein